MIRKMNIPFGRNSRRIITDAENENSLYQLLYLQFRKCILSIDIAIRRLAVLSCAYNLLLRSKV